VSVSRDEFNIGSELEAVHVPVRHIVSDQLVVRNDFLSTGFSNATLS
jgi:hypothetical protein